MKTRYGLEIRAATTADATGLSELIGTTGHMITPRVLAERLEAIRQQPGVVLVAAAWGPPSGLVITQWYRTLEADQPTAQITTLLVGADERRRGIGRLLIKAAAHAGRVAGCDVLEIMATPTQRDLREFCQGIGFTETGCRFVRGLRKRNSQDLLP